MNRPQKLGDSADLRQRLVSRLRSATGRPVNISLADLQRRMRKRGLVPSLFIEVGANDGTDTNKLLEAFPEIEIHCFEPDPRAIAAFK